MSTRNRGATRGVLLSVAVLLATVVLACAEPRPHADAYAGSRSCKGCHGSFYDLWSTSRHGLAMQPFSSELAAAALRGPANEIGVGEYRYRADVSGPEGWVNEEGPGGRKRYRIEHVLGGKNVYYFLTPLEKGRLQTLPLAYDVRRQEWFDMAGSGMRHFPDRGPDAPVAWRDWPYTFNTSCHGCHVSQLATNYDLGSDTYHTVWLEPGINCETCHGPSAEHNRLFTELPAGAPPPQDPRIISIKNFTPEQRNDSCSVCHAKASALTASYPPGERFFDHFDLVTLESADYYPDGRDLGENYTYTTWLMSPCTKDGTLDCLGCHTSSGRYRFQSADEANDACLPCHADRVSDAAAHTHHAPDSPGNRCVSCHMPTTEFARMRRSDHSMRPPAPAATIRFQSPNACNGCHDGETPEWADRRVREWYAHDYQAPVLKRAELIDAARKGDWTRLPEMLDAITGEGRDEVSANSLIRLLRAADDQRVEPALLAALRDPSPLIRSSAAESLGLILSPAALDALVAATNDDYRLVRLRAAQTLAAVPGLAMDATRAPNVGRAVEEHLASLMARPDQWTSHYNLGNYHLNRGEYAEAVSAYETALRFESREVPPLVNLSIARARQGDNAGADEALRRALALEPANAEANFNVGLLAAERNDLPRAEAHLRRALETDPQLAAAAYNLCVLLGEQRLDEALELCHRAATLRKREPRYAWTHAYYLNKKGEHAAAAAELRDLLTREPAYADGWLLLADILDDQGDRRGAREVYERALRNGALGALDRARIEEAARVLDSRPGGNAG